MHGHAKILRPAAVTAAVAILVVAGRLISGSLDAPGSQGPGVPAAQLEPA